METQLQQQFQFVLMRLFNIKKGDLIMTIAFGAGYTWGGNLIRL